MMLFDEATSHLDVLTERVVDQNLNALACTRIVIAHRLSTVCHANVIIVLEEGAIVERGTHAELMALGGHFRQLVESQALDGVAQEPGPSAGHTESEREEARSALSEEDRRRLRLLGINMMIRARS